MENETFKIEKTTKDGAEVVTIVHPKSKERGKKAKSAAKEFNQSKT